MPGASTFDLLDILYDRKLCEHLTAWRDEGLSLEDIRDIVEREKGYRPGRESVRRWLSGECS